MSTDNDEPLTRTVRSTDNGSGGGGGDRFLCFARVNDGDGGLAVCATDGVGLWKDRIENAHQFVAGYLPPPRSTVPLSTKSAKGDELLTKFK